MPTNNPPITVEEAQQVVHKHLIDSGVYKSCLNCANFHQRNSTCTLWEATPPAAILVYSCKDRWELDIPF